MVQDEDGFIWIATPSGLNRFDGKDFVKFYSTGSSYSLPGNYISEIVCLPQHRLALATRNGLAILNTQTGICKQLNIPADSVLKTATNSIDHIITDKKGDLIVGTHCGVYVFNKYLKLIFRYDAYKPSDVLKKPLFFLTTLNLLPDGTVLIFSVDTFIYLLNIQQKSFRDIKDIPGSAFDLLKCWDGKIKDLTWQGTGKAQFFFINFNYNKGSDSIFVVDLSHKKALASPLSFSVKKEMHWQSGIFLQNDTLLYITLENHHGVCLLHFDPRTLAVSGFQNILKGTLCWNIMTDKNNRLWACTEEGVFKQSLSKAAFHNFILKDEENVIAGDENITGLLHYGHRYFITRWGIGVLVYDDNLHFIRSVNLAKAGKENFPIDVTYYAKDSLLIATQDGALLFSTKDYGLKKLWQPGMPTAIDSVGIVSSFKDNHHQLWLGLSGGNGVFTLNIDTHAWKYFSPKVSNPVFKIRYAQSIAADTNGNIWMSGLQGITRWNSKKENFDTLINKLPGIGDITDSWNSLLCDAQNNLWIVEKNFTLVKWNLSTGRLSYFQRPENIPPSNMGNITGPYNNNLWIQTDNGLLSFNTKTEQFHLIKKTDGLFSDDVTNAVYFDTSTQRLFVGFMNDFNWFYPGDVLKKREPVQPVITDIRKIGDSVSLSKDSMLSFSYKENSIAISFTGINYDDGLSNTYAYRLFEKKPSPFINIGGQKTVTFASLKPGNYTFQAETILSDGTTSKQPTTLHFIIAYPYYETWWFYTLCAVLFAAGLYALYRYRINQLLQLQHVRDNISADLHDDIGARLTSINLLSALGEQNVNEPQQVSDYLKRIGTEVQNSGEALDDIVWSINTRNDSMEEITARMRRYASEIFDKTNVQYFMEMQGGVPGVKLNMEKRKDIFLLYKEVINNIYKHASATEVRIYMSAIKHTFLMNISDNGKGFNVQHPTLRNGLKNMQFRMKKYNGSVVINSAVGSGTAIEIKLPF